jgi:hypothetical protein
LITQKKYTAPTPFGDVSVFFQQALIGLYILLLLVSFWAVDWQYFSWLSVIVVTYIGLFIADFGSGLVHLYIDYRPLNYAKGYGKLYDYRGDRGSDEFIDMKKSITSQSNWFDHTVYAFKLHHRNAIPCLTTKYSEFFIETALPGFLFLFFSMFVSAFYPKAAWTSYLAYFIIIVSVAVLHTDIIHAWVHGSRAMPLGATFARFLIKYKLIYSAKTHAIHHRDGLTGFCFIIGHANFAVNWICKKLLERGVIHVDDWHGIQKTDQSNSVANSN